MASVAHRAKVEERYQAYALIDSGLVLKNAPGFTDFHWLTLHLDEKSAIRTEVYQSLVGDRRVSC